MDHVQLEARLWQLAVHKALPQLWLLDSPGVKRGAPSCGDVIVA